MKRLLSNLFGTKNSSVRQQPSKHARLGVESLEDRRLMSAGYLDPSFAYSGVAKAAFDRGGSLYDSAEAVAIQSDGKIVVAGTVETSGGYDFAVTRFNPDGSPDFDFGSWSRTTIGFNLGGQNEDMPCAVAIDAEGRIVVAGTVERGGGNRDFGVIRLTPEGQLDTSFGSNGYSVAAIDLYGHSRIDIANDMTLDDAGRILIVGTSNYGYFQDTDMSVVRLTPDGFFDDSFGFGGKTSVAFNLGGNLADQAAAIAVDAYGRIVIAGTAEGYSGDADFAIARLLDDGALDGFFGDYGRSVAGFALTDDNGEQWWTYCSDYASDMVIDDLGRIIVVGSTYALGVSSGGANYAVTRLTEDGFFDTSFGINGRQIIDFNTGGRSADFASAVTIDHQGRIVVAGRSTANYVSGSIWLTPYDSSVVRLLDDGSLDESFGDSGRFVFGASTYGASDMANDIAIDADGQIVLIGAAQWLPNSNDHDFYVARLISDE